ncbi:hypothetical protein HDU97_001026 [Phlyctochytrium planicorne]|nr:hypothetical protein HDU97_001026 [Phlyctochytrium planicorne]
MQPPSHTKLERVWRPSWFLQTTHPDTPPASVTNTPISSASHAPTHHRRPAAALIILNQPLPDVSWLDRLWASASVKLCADGGANRLFDLCGSDEVRMRFLPDRIIGDLDSLRLEVKRWYEGKGVAVERQHSQDSTDFGKCVSHIESLEAKISEPVPTPPTLADAVEGTSQFPPVGTAPAPVYELIVIGALGGRFDQTMASVNSLVAIGKERKVYLVCNDSIVTLLTPDFDHLIECERSIEGPTCGLIPIGCSVANMETEGLKWNIDKSMPSSFGGMVSTSNAFAEPGVDGTAFIRVKTDEKVLWTVECNLH